MILRFERMQHPVEWPTLAGVASRSLLLRTIPTRLADMEFWHTNQTMFAPLNVQSQWTWQSSLDDGAITQVWGRAPYGSATAPVDANVLIANGAVILSYVFTHLLCSCILSLNTLCE
jgi:hypothetical protein